ncbi:NUDIX hydrolase [Liquorilactobacillus cacaonum]|uniref:ADP-ribose pyrophosphatase n=1 Tax=Liquorilactobacillus cacaonum DSM 21116 TaxID=1423729 RepID=A0A0R2CFI0_9LACO|nr:NUDIX hydrolase [Liquorilactobacillus cacaonum]KRM90263.1 ADP-ribose pyrophosphatase [Liquorilactobacillus cacaonum DSM 21116]
MANYIQMIRNFVGHTPIILNAAGGVILNERKEVLLNLRVDSNDWSLPGGYLEFGETFAQACVREVKEDSGLDVSIISLLGTFDNDLTEYPNGDVAQVISQLFLVKQIGGKLLEERSEETLDLKYFALDKLPPLFNQQNKEMLLVC